MVNLKCYISCFSGSFFSHEQCNFVFRAERDVDQPVASSRLMAAFLDWKVDTLTLFQTRCI